MKKKLTYSLRAIACIPILGALGEAFFHAYSQDIFLFSTNSFLSAMVMCQLYAFIEIYILHYGKYELVRK